MFPTLSSLIEYLFNVHISLPIKTFGFFFALSFVAAYVVFRSEFKRKESLGLVHAFKRTVIVGKPSSAFELFVNGILGFVLGFKGIGAIIAYRHFLNDPSHFMLSFQGNLVAGLICSAVFTYWIYADRKKEQMSTPKTVEETVHPYQLMGRIVFFVGFWGLIGAKLFDCLEHPHSFLYDPIQNLLNPNGLTYYGGLICGGAAFLYYGYKHGMKLVHLFDIGPPGMMLAYAVGRIGCHLSGDGDWGIINTYTKPHWLHWLPDWAWSFTFPHNVINEGVLIKNCFGDFCHVLPFGVYPTSFYEATICMLLFFFLWAIRKHIHTPGLMIYIYLIINGIERFFIEKIRITQLYYVFGLSFTQAQFICVGMILIGIGGIIYLYINNKFIVQRSLKGERS